MYMPLGPPRMCITIIYIVIHKTHILWRSKHHQLKGIGSRLCKWLFGRPPLGARVSASFRCRIVDKMSSRVDFLAMRRVQRRQRKGKQSVFSSAHQPHVFYLFSLNSRMPSLGASVCLLDNWNAVTTYLMAYALNYCALGFVEMPSIYPSIRPAANGD